MTDIVNQQSGGTIAGFSSPDLFPSTLDITKTGWSIDVLRRFLLNEGNNNFPSYDWLFELEQAITAHLSDVNNPHHVTLDQVIETITKSIIGKVIPGTPPDYPPFFGYDAICPIPLNTIFPVTYQISNVYRTTHSGKIVDVATDTEVLGVDHTHNVAAIPLFSSFTNLVPSDWMQSTSLANYSSVAKTTFPSSNLPFDFYRVAETTASGEIGILVPVNEVASKLHTLTIFISALPTIDGSFIFRAKGDSVNYMTVDVKTGSFSVSSALVAGDVEQLPNNVFKVSFSYTSNSVPNNAVQIIHQRSGDTTLNRIGNPGAALFLFAYPTVANLAIGYPLPVDISKPVTTTPFVPRLADLGVTATLTELMVTLSFSLKPLPSTIALNDNQTLLSFDYIRLERDWTNVYLRVNGTVLASSSILDGLNVFSLSLSPTNILFKDLAGEKHSFDAAYAPIKTNDVKIGPCNGYLRNVSFYAQSDHSQTLEFLTNG